MRRLRLRVRDLNDPDVDETVGTLVRRAIAVDGQPPFNDQARLDARTGSRTLITAIVPSDDDDSETVIGAAILGQGELEFTIDPEWRSYGYGDAALGALVGSAPPALSAWAHGDHPAAGALAARHGFARVRTLLQLRMPLAARVPSTGAPRGDLEISAFVPGRDEDDWVALNAIAFADHPEQGRLTADDVRAREAESWFSADDLLLARDPDGRLVGSIWLKVEDGIGEVYAVGVHPDRAGAGIGRELMRAGLDRLEASGVETAALYVESDNEPATHLYRSIGFTDHTVDVQYRRDPSAPAR
ncbi:mycothiol synthase [Labedella endophytica]|uniref:Mycothiol acetyltransferase n=1 Tax=Labedella endophytica TaxID=1523160 RepID=A0A433JQP7_9MICO|nr:mycothiol synthase [Labedella endophytica]RUQ99006.1 mycothiol synthase [Labedella endophytica]